ncbi:MAG TPA: YvcK family protein [Candidatus Paceibacterota bacterium]|nr:YvcK family protein [Candidatus Paceibacterota bacterium]
MNIVTIGGGTGTFVVLSALRRLPNLSLSAIVSSADDGGSTGRLRDAYGFLPLGDARQALVALAEDGPVLRDLFAYRFAKGDIKGHNLGNLFLTALTDLLGSDTKALEEASRILRVSGRVIPASEVPATLMATLADGSTLRGEHVIDEPNANRSAINQVYLETDVSASPSALEAIREADVIILGPGDLYASTVAPLLPAGMREAIASSKGKLIYIVNLFTKAGQTGGMSVSDYLREIERYAGRAPERVLIHKNGGFEANVLERYAEEGESPVTDDLGEDERASRASVASVHIVPPVPEDPVPRSLARHDPEKLAAALAPLITL